MENSWCGTWHWCNCVMC